MTPLTFTIAQKSRPAGTYEVPAAGPYPQLPAGYTWAEVQLNLAQVDYELTTNAVTYGVFVSPDGANWVLACRTNWSGGRKVSHSGTVDPPQIIGVGVGGWPGWYVKGVVTINATMSIGFTVTLT